MFIKLKKSNGVLNRNFVAYWIRMLLIIISDRAKSKVIKNIELYKKFQIAQTAYCLKLIIKFMKIDW